MLLIASTLVVGQPCLLGSLQSRFHVSSLAVIRAVYFRLFQEPDTQNWNASDTRVPVNNFVKHINTAECIK